MAGETMRGEPVGSFFRSCVAAVLVAVLGACATLPANPPRAPSQAYVDTDQTTLAAATAKQTATHPGQSGVLLLGDGLDAYVARAVLAEAAERSIDVQYYLYHADDTGKFLTYQLLKAADRGVRVRFLVDDMGMSGRDLGIVAVDAHPNIEVRIFNPFSRKTSRLVQMVTRFGSVTRRMHNKSFTVDNRVTIVGGRNIGNEYFDLDPTLQFGDLDALAIGPVVQEVSEAFDLYWNHELAYPIEALVEGKPTQEQMAELRAELDAFAEEMRVSPYAEALHDSGLAEAMRSRTMAYSWGDATTVYDQPEKLRQSTTRKDLHLSTQLNPYFKAVRKELIIFSPYFVPGSEGVRFLRGLVERGVRVRVVTNSLASTDVGIVHAGYAKYRAALVRSGVELFEIDKTLTRKQRKTKKKEKGIGSKASLHAKTFILDRETVFIGSLNLDPRSVIQNTEIGIVLKAPELAQKMAERFDASVEGKAFRVELYDHPSGAEGMRWVKGDEIFYNEPQVGFWRSLGVGLMGLLPIESQI